LASAVDQIEDPITDTHKRRGKLGGAREGKSTEGVVRGGRRENVVKKRKERNGEPASRRVPHCRGSEDWENT